MMTFSVLNFLSPVILICAARGELISSSHGLRYLWPQKKLSWASAIDYCRNLNGELLSIKTAVDLEFIQNCTESSKGFKLGLYFVGVTWSEGSGWTWLRDGGKLEFWENNNHTRPYDCVSCSRCVVADASSWYRHDCSSHDKHHFICEMDEQNTTGETENILVVTTIDDNLMEKSNPCSGINCTPGGLCRLSETGFPYCECPQDSQTCQRTFCRGECLHNGLCHNRSGTFLCVCVDNFTGERCESVLYRGDDSIVQSLNDSKETDTGVPSIQETPVIGAAMSSEEQYSLSTILLAIIIGVVVSVVSCILTVALILFACRCFGYRLAKESDRSYTRAMLNSDSSEPEYTGLAGRGRDIEGVPPPARCTDQNNNLVQVMLPSGSGSGSSVSSRTYESVDDSLLESIERVRCERASRLSEQYLTVTLSSAHHTADSQ